MYSYRQQNAVWTHVIMESLIFSIASSSTPTQPCVVSIKPIQSSLLRTSFPSPLTSHISSSPTPSLPQMTHQSTPNLPKDEKSEGEDQNENNESMDEQNNVMEEDDQIISKKCEATFVKQNDIKGKKNGPYTVN